MQQNVRVSKMFLERDVRMAGCGIGENFNYHGSRVYALEFENADGATGSDKLSINYIDYSASTCDGLMPDLTSTGGSALNAAEALRQIGARVSHCFSIFTYELPQARDAFHHAGLELVFLSGLSTLLKVATSSGRITAEEERAVREWLARGSIVASRVDPVTP